MDSFEKYTKRLGISRRSTTENLIESSRMKFERNFSTSPSFYKVDINGETVDTIINKTNNYSVKLIHFRTNYKPQTGSIITYNNQKHLLLEIDSDEVFQFGKMEECNYTIPIQIGEEERVLVGYDSFDKPVYKYEAEFKEEPCIIREKYYTSDENAQLPLPEGKLEILFKYQDIPNLKMNEEVILYDKTYKVVDISYIHVQNDTGFLKLYAERRDNKE